MEQRVFLDGPCWACIIHIAQEPFKALFDFETDAWAAFRAACPQDEESTAPDVTEHAAVAMASTGDVAMEAASTQPMHMDSIHMVQ
jgi:hypothetical protein